MAMRIDLAARAAALTEAGTPFVWATVVRAERPTSAKPGDSAIVAADGRFEGFVGGECAESSVRSQALQVLATGEPRLLRITPNPDEPDDPDEGVVSVHNACLSGGTLEVFLEPATPLPMVAVVGDGPIASALVRADGLMGQHVVPLAASDPVPDGTLAVVVATHGREEEPALEAALHAEVPYVALVASRRRGPSVVASLDVSENERDRVRTPAGLDIGARSAPEVALSILAEVVEVLGARTADHHHGPTLAITDADPVVDPVCGMQVAPVDSSVHAETAGGTVYFCGVGCREAYLADPAAYAS